MSSSDETIEDMMAGSFAWPKADIVQEFCGQDVISYGRFLCLRVAGGQYGERSYNVVMFSELSEVLANRQSLENFIQPILQVDPGCYKVSRAAMKEADYPHKRFISHVHCNGIRGSLPAMQLVHLRHHLRVSDDSPIRIFLEKLSTVFEHLNEAEGWARLPKVTEYLLYAPWLDVYFLSESSFINAMMEMIGAETAFVSEHGRLTDAIRDRMSWEHNVDTI